MKRLSYHVLQEIGYKGFVLKDAPVKVLQFGEGNFLRAFVDYFFDVANEKSAWNGKVVITLPIGAGKDAVFREQECLYTLCTRGREGDRTIDEKRVISVVKDCLNTIDKFDKVIETACLDSLEYIVSNTTEAGIVYVPEARYDEKPPRSFPAKLTKVLHKRFEAGKKGLVILSCELIDANGRALLDCVKKHAEDWDLGEAFVCWLLEENTFCSTLVDRIVPGAITDKDALAQLHTENDYEDQLIDVGEVFAVWYIEGDETLEVRLPFKEAGLPVHVVPDITPYKKRKVRILNGAHTGFVPAAFLTGKDIVRDCMEDETIHAFVQKMLKNEIIPILPLNKDDLSAFADAVCDRFNNPFIDHALLSISLNSSSKWRVRNMPSLLEYVEKFHELPPCLVMSLAAYIAFATTGMEMRTKDAIVCRRADGTAYEVKDDVAVLDFFWTHKGAEDANLVHDALTNETLWGMDLTQVEGLEAAVGSSLALLREDPKRALASCL